MLFNRSFMQKASPQERLRAVKEVDLRSLAHLGDAVFELHTRERVFSSDRARVSSVQKLHNKVVGRVNSKEQARLLNMLKPHLNEIEEDIVRRARNLKVGGFRKNVEQSVLRQATAFEALIGFLYLLDESRLEVVLDLTETTEPEAAES